MSEIEKNKITEASESNASEQAKQQSTTSIALEAAGDSASAKDIGALDDVAQAVDKKLAAQRSSLVERLIYGPAPDKAELQSGAETCIALEKTKEPIVEAAIDCLAKGEAFTTNGKISDQLREAVTHEKAYGFTVPAEFNGKEGSYSQLAHIEELLAAQGLGALAVEISGQLTIGASSVLGYGSDQQKKTYLPMLVEGRLMAFGLTEVGVGVNAKKIQAYVEEDENGNYRLFADGPRNKLWITSATQGGLVGIVARMGRDSRKVSLFVIELPKRNINITAKTDYEFRCEHSGVAAFEANINSRVHFKNFPIPKENRIPADGVEVLFYCLRMGRCMLAAMSAGYQRMLARDASHFAIQRIGVGGPVIKHEIPRLALAKMLGGSLQSKALSYLSLKQDEDGVDLAGLRDLTKSAAANTAIDSMVACEHVLGGRSFAKASRVNDARVNLHLFGVVEGEDNMIRMGMVRDVTLKFVNTYLSSLLGTLNSINQGDDGKPLPAKERILRLTASTFMSSPGKSLKAVKQLLLSKTVYQLIGWCLSNAFKDLLAIPNKLIPSFVHSKYKDLPAPLRHHARYAETQIRRLRWQYLGISMYYQLELTRAQIPLQRIGLCIEHLVSMLVICHHAAATKDESTIHVAAIQAQLLKDKYRGVKLLGGLFEMERLRDSVNQVGDQMANNECTLLNDIEPEQYAHPWQEK